MVLARKFPSLIERTARYYQHNKSWFRLLQPNRFSSPSPRYGSNPLEVWNNVTRRTFSSSTTNPEETPREVMSFDVLIVGGGPAGLAAAIRLKQLSQETGQDLSVCLIDKGSEIGSHILSGNVFDPKALLELFPDYQGNDNWTKELLSAVGSHATPVTQDRFLILNESGSSYSIPHVLLPPQLHNHGNYIISLSQLCRWLAQKAEELGAEIYPGFSASEVLIHPEDGVYGVATRDVGLDKHEQPKASFERGVELHARQTIFAEGARGSCSEFLMQKFGLRNAPTIHHQTYGLGLKEVWQIPTSSFQPGLVQHSLGFPLQSSLMDKVFGGSFVYHQEPDLVLIGLVIGLDYANPFINPYQEFQRFKTHPDIKKHLQGGTCISYGARVLNEGGYHAIPKLTFPGGLLVGCSAGFLNAVKIKGSHTAMKSGMLAAQSIFDALTTTDESNNSSSSSSTTVPQELTSYSTAFEKSWIRDELYQVRNCHAAFAKWGVGGGLLYAGLATHVTKGLEPWTLTHGLSDSESTQPASQHQPIVYPPPDGVLTFDLLTNLQRTGTYHAEDQPIHLRIKKDCQHIPNQISLPKYEAPEQRFCPAAVYEYVEDHQSPSENAAPTTNHHKKKLVINSQNCIHCKCCSIKMPGEYIEWTVPEGGGGPQYQVM